MQPFAIDVKGGGKASNRRQGLDIGLLVDVLPSMPKGETIGNVVIDGKRDGKGGVPEPTNFEAERQQRNRG